jgi:lysophospholipase L1-like esterase
MRSLIMAILIGAAALGICKFAMLGVRVRRGAKIAGASRPFERINPTAAHRILVVGDSTGVGTGASRPEDSVAGRIASEFPGTEVVNLARNGARATDAIIQLESVAAREFDVALVQVGGNDILRFTGLGKLRSAIGQVLAKAREKGRTVIFIGPGNSGLSPAFFPPLSWIYTGRTRRARTLFMDASAKTGARYVDLFRERDNRIFPGDPDRYYSPDRFHPCSEGYRVWYEEMKTQAGLAGILGQGPAKSSGD